MLLTEVIYTFIFFKKKKFYIILIRKNKIFIIY